MYGEQFNQLVKEIGKETGIKVEELSYGYLLKLTKGKKKHYIIGYKFDLNSQASGNIAKDKYSTYVILKEEKIPVVEYKALFHPIRRAKYQNENTEKEIYEYFEKNHNRLVIKPNNGQEGIGVSLCKQKEELIPIIEKLFQDNNTLVMCPFYEIETEYRTIYLDGQCMLTYGKKIPYIIGDGIHSIEELIRKNDRIKIEKIKDETKQEIDFKRVPKLQEKVEILWKHNLSGGAIPEIIQNKELEKRIHQIVKQTAKALNLRFASIDVIQTKTGELYVLEVNSGIFMKNFMEEYQNGYQIAKKIYKKAIKNAFHKS